MAEGKQHALAIGYTKMSAQDMYVLSLKYFVQCIILLWVEMLLTTAGERMCAHDLFVPGCCRRSINKGIGVDNMHYLNDGLWKVCPPFVLCILLASYILLLMVPEQV
jgi:hypothetical protein